VLAPISLLLATGCQRSSAAAAARHGTDGALAPDEATVLRASEATENTLAAHPRRASPRPRLPLQSPQVHRTTRLHPAGKV